MEINYYHPNLHKIVEILHRDGHLVQNCSQLPGILNLPGPNYDSHFQLDPRKAITFFVNKWIGVNGSLATVEALARLLYESQFVSCSGEPPEREM